MIPLNRAELARQFHGEGVELGVAAGAYSETIHREGKIRRLWSVDRWSDHHGTAEYFAASRRLSRIGGGRIVCLRCTFDEALPLFPDGSLDFVYVDGYAHTGQEGGATLDQWWPKVRPGGILAGHDYHPRWRPTMDAVDAFLSARGLPLNLTADPNEPGADTFTSWWTVRPAVGAPALFSAPEWLPAPPISGGSRIVLVGNGPSALRRGDRGAEIDAYDVVVRFNAYAIRGFEPMVGRRTDLWTTFGHGTRPRDEGEVPACALHVRDDPPHLPTLPVPVPRACGIGRAYYESVRARLRARSHRTGDARDRLLPSSGLVVALWLIEQGHAGRVTLFGFDHFSKAESGQHHYWIPSNFIPPPEHDGEAEEEWFAELLVAGRVEYLR